ncbi:phytanoyl-CoA dioxygenase family protein [Luteipulveratus mongoliensis]|uniref:Phytanoyl-CoA dioxygenase n=1 Tax=Luteipulveratus mongoliensis TaxID=571913 RepID=A0A0K1JNM1_9MICO|nr:phytanoyl-CoA dioxygenase family protein [Luteipulveratus mongoliensis]AKU18314.1 phytanoyl-CoA dioxygenase [Luteipulveratus mongoliensis]
MNVDRKHLLASVEMAHFVSHGSLVLESAVPESLNARAISVLDAGMDRHPYGTALDTAFPQGTFVRELLDLPAVAGAIQSLVGPRPVIDHHAVHVRPPRGGEAQNLHADAVLDPRVDAFDVQLMYYPKAVTLEQGGTLSVPGTHLRRINESGIGRYQNLAGQTRLTCPAGTVVLLHHAIWHSGRRNDSDQPRYMFKIRFNPTVRQLRLWNTDDIDDPAVRAALTTTFPWSAGPEGRLELINRARLWRSLTGDADFDIDYYLTRAQLRPQTVDSAATDSRLGGGRTADGWAMA